MRHYGDDEFRPIPWWRYELLRWGEAFALAIAIMAFFWIILIIWHNI